MAHRKRIDVRITPEACFFGALALLVLPLRWIIAAILAACIHECCHGLALWFCGVRIYGLSIGSAGAMIETEPMGAFQELVCALAGPAGSLLLVLLLRWVPELAICAGVQGLFNLIPIYPLDGGRIVNSFLGLFCPNSQKRIMKWLQIVVSLAIGGIGVFCFVWLKLGAGMLALTAFVICRALGRKIPCKEGRKRVQ